MKSFLSDRPRIPTPDTAPNRESALALASDPNPKKSEHHLYGGPKSSSVNCVREGDRIIRLVVTCTCGERIEIECLYAAGS
jgi:hypothetical protein